MKKYNLTDIYLSAVCRKYDVEPWHLNSKFQIPPRLQERIDRLKYEYELS